MSIVCFFVLAYIILLLCCVGYSFFSTKPEDWGWKERLRNDLLCVVGSKTLAN